MFFPRLNLILPVGALGTELKGTPHWSGALLKSDRVVGLQASQYCTRKMANQQPEYVQEGLKQIATDQGFTPGRFRVEYESGTAAGDGFVGTMEKAFIREDGHEELMVLLKLLPEHELRKQQSILMFHREAMMYNVVLPAFRKFQAEKDLAEDEGFWRIPKCYYAVCEMEKMEGVVVMEDLRKNNFRMWDKLKPVDFDHSRLLVEQLGMLHAVSFAMKEQQPERFAPFKMLVDPLKIQIEMDPQKGIHALFAQLYERAFGTLDENDKETKEHFEKLKGIVTETYIDCVNAEDAEPYAIIGHGDCWVNNIMYSYDGNEPTPTDIRLIDWQLGRYVSPVLDLAYFIFICTDGEFREKHFEELLDIYYTSLAEHLKRLGGDVTQQFPRDAFEAQWKKFGKFGLVMGMLVLPILCTEKDDQPDMGEYMEKAEKDGQAEFGFATSGKAQEVYRKRMAAIIRDVVRLGYL